MFPIRSRSRRAASGRLPGRDRTSTSRGRPAVPDRPRSWLSMRRASWRSVPRMWRPPASTTLLWLSVHSRPPRIMCSAPCSCPGRASAPASLLGLVEIRREHRQLEILPEGGIVDRHVRFELVDVHFSCRPGRCRCRGPAMFVAMVTEPGLPASAMIRASCSWNFAFSTLWMIPLAWRMPRKLLRFFDGYGSHQDRLALASELARFPRRWRRIFPSRSGRPCRGSPSCIIGMFVGTTTTSSLYIFLNSTASVSAVPVMPASFLYMRKKFWKVIVARVWLSRAMVTFSLASRAWCRPSE